MTILNKLKLSDKTRSNTIKSPVEHRRSKMLTLIKRQIKAFEANEQGQFHTYPAMKMVTNSETGDRTRREVRIKVRPWWWKDEADKYYLTLKYGNRRLKLDNTNSTIEVGTKSKLVPLLNSLSEATRAGELDGAIKQALRKASS